MRRISNKATISTKLWIIIAGPIFYVLATISEIQYSRDVENFWDLGFVILQLLLIVSLGTSLDYAIRLKIVYINDTSIMVKGVKKSELLPISDIKAIRSHRLIIKINRPLVITFKNRTIFGKKIYIYPTITDKNNKINFLEVIEIEEHLNKLLEINRAPGQNAGI